MRDKQLNIRLSTDEEARLAALCDHLGVNAANLIRMLLKEKARELGVEPAAAPAPAPPSKPRRRK